MTPLRVRIAPARRILAALLTTVTVTGALLLAPAGAAQAGWPHQVTPVLVAHTDSRARDQAFPVTDGDLPVGSWTDTAGRRHVSRAYVTVDLSRYAGRRIVAATLGLDETSVADCTRPRAVEVWRTSATTTAPTWARAPRPIARFGTLPATGACPGQGLTADVTPALEQARRDGAAVATLMVRVPAKDENDPAAGRRIAGLALEVQDNTAPTVSDRLSVSGVACTPDGIRVGTPTPELRAEFDDADFRSGGDELTVTFAHWPVDRPGDRTEVAITEQRSAQQLRHRLAEPLLNGMTYAYAVRATDRHGDSSAWTPECRFTVDTTPPRMPSVVSAEYPVEGAHGGPGITGRFTFTAAPGDTDVASFHYEINGGVPNPVPATADGTATIEYTPTRYGTNRLTVFAVDRTGNRSTPAEYSFLVSRTAPEVTDHDPEAAFGTPRTFTFAPLMADVVSYTYWMNDGPRTTVPAGADRTATVQATPDRPGENTLHVVSRTSTGQSSADAEWPISVSTRPSITSPDLPDDGSDPPLSGTEITVVFRPGMPGVTGYVWSHDFDGEEHEIAAGPDGTATLRWRSRDHGALALSVRSRTADGVESETASVYWHLTVHYPTVTSAEYPEYQTAGGPGVTGTFAFRPARPGVTAYTYRFGENGSERTVPAGADGTASVTWTPDAGGRHQIFVREHVGDVVSQATEYAFVVAN